jgi:pepF/M3 family oligoendopeptidase
MATDFATGFPVKDPSWELDTIFAGGVDSAEFERAVEDLGEGVEAMLGRVEGLESLDGAGRLGEAALEAWVEFFEEMEALADRAHEASSWANCVAVTHTDNPRALRLPVRLNAVHAGFATLRVAVEARFRHAGDEVFGQISGHPRLKRCSLYLEELRRDARAKMEPELENLAVALNRDGLHAWGQLYDQVSAGIKIEVARDGESKTMSVGQAKNLMSDPERAVRQAAYNALQQGWSAQTSTLATALNSIIGSEHTLYTRRGGDELTEPLQNNRVERASVMAMMEAADEFRDVLVDYMQAKAGLLGLDRLAWYDLEAPVGAVRDEKISYEDAQKFIIEQAGAFSEPMSRFYQEALAKRWVEVEDRPGKAQGGFCTGLPVSKEIRIFMTFGGTSSGVQTLAHELGHAYHGWLMRDLGAFEREVPMGLAETASTLSEALVESAALERARGAEKLRLLDERLQRAVAFLIDIPARFRLERAMHAERAGGRELNADRLTEMTTEIFGAGFGDGVSHVEPTFWASKLHFFITHQPFYNFPYAFGYLFSRAVYGRARAEGPGYAGVVDEMLVDTGRITAEEIGRRYLDADLSDPAFWREAAGGVREDVAEFKRLLAAAPEG